MNYDSDGTFTMDEQGNWYQVEDPPTYSSDVPYDQDAVDPKERTFSFSGVANVYMETDALGNVLSASVTIMDGMEPLENNDDGDEREIPDEEWDVCALASEKGWKLPFALPQHLYWEEG